MAGRSRAAYSNELLLKNRMSSIRCSFLVLLGGIAQTIHSTPSVLRINAPHSVKKERRFVKFYMTPGIRSKGRIPVDHVPVRGGDCLPILALQLHFQMRIKAGGDLPAEQGEGPAVPDPPDADLLPLLGHSGAGGIQKQNHLIHRVLPAVLKGDRHVHGAVWRKQIPAEVAFGDLLPGRIIEIDACNLRILRRRPAVLMRAVKDPAQRRQQRQAEEPCRQRQPLPPPQRDGGAVSLST